MNAKHLCNSSILFAAVARASYYSSCNLYVLGILSVFDLSTGVAF